MDNLVKKELSLPFSENDLRTLCSASDAPARRTHHVPIVSYSDVRKHPHLDSVLGKEGTAVIWFRTSQNGGHWTSLIRVAPHVVEFFCPYGMPMDTQLKLIPPAFRDGQDRPYLTDLCQRSGYRVISNGMKLQKMRSRVSSCGRFVGIRIAMFQQGMRDLRQFQNLFRNQKLSPDDYSALLSMSIR